jgi:hypothetical protein
MTQGKSADVWQTDPPWISSIIPRRHSTYKKIPEKLIKPVRKVLTSNMIHVYVHIIHILISERD